MKNNSFARFARVFFIFFAFRRRSRSFHNVKRPVLQLSGRREHMMTKVQFCLFISQALVPISFQDGWNTIYRRDDFQ